MFIVDQKYGLEEVLALAGFVDQIDPRVRDLLEEHWTGDQSPDFMLGLLAGYTNAHAYLAQSPQLVDIERRKPVSSLSAFVADKLLAHPDFPG